MPACSHCHDLKDRVALKNWTEDDFARAIGEMGRTGRILYAKMLFLMFDYRKRLGIPIFPVEARELLGIEDGEAAA